ncbi:MAG: cell division protein FtsQ/DivIB [Bacteroidetes bacterium]|nr:cell division protein FtsQ/DivIB [Bacteroidota bacterium]
MNKQKVMEVLPWVTYILLIGACLIWISIRNQERTINKIVINIDNQINNYFLDDSDVVRLLSDGGDEKILGASVENLSLKILENRLKNHKFVSNTEVSTDFQGNLFVSITQSKPIARILRQDGPGAYVSKEGQVLPLSEKYTARVVLLSGEYTRKLWLDNLAETPYGQQLLALLQIIDQDPFWRAQIAEVNIDQKGDIRLYPQVTRQVIEFGKAENLEEKFEKLMIFYSRILPAKGWNTYQRVNLKYSKQIVCE